MILYVNKKNEIKDVNITSDQSLTPLEVNDDSNPFLNWSVAKICCHKVKVDENGIITEYTPYVDSRLIEHIEKLGKSDESAASDISITQIGLTETFENSTLNAQQITELQLAVVEIYEMIVGGTE